jgi:hypothetical protein
VVDHFWGNGEEEAHRRGLSAVEGIDGEEKTPASRSRGHWLGQSIWGGNTRRRGARGVVDSAEERLWQTVRDGAGRSGSEGPKGLSGLKLEKS